MAKAPAQSKEAPKVESEHTFSKADIEAVTAKAEGKLAAIQARLKQVDEENKSLRVRAAAANLTDEQIEALSAPAAAWMQDAKRLGKQHQLEAWQVDHIASEPDMERRERLAESMAPKKADEAILASVKERTGETDPKREELLPGPGARTSRSAQGVTTGRPPLDPRGRNVADLRAWAAGNEREILEKYNLV